jgi:hypothetical protein
MGFDPKSPAIRQAVERGLIAGPSPEPAAAHKYGAAGFWDDQGVYWHSKKEHARWQELTLLEAQGVIRDLRRGKGCRYRLEVNGVLVCHYTPDAVYVVVKTGKTTVEDTKGYVTREFKRTKRLMLAVHGIEVVEV